MAFLKSLPTETQIDDSSVSNYKVDMKMQCQTITRVFLHNCKTARCSQGATAFFHIWS